MIRHPKLVLAVTIAACLTALLYGPVERRILAVQILRAMSSESRADPPPPGALFEGISLRDGTPVRTRVYGPPAEDARQIIVAFHGIHHLGIDEPRLIRFARHLANRGYRVLTPEIREFTDYQVTKGGVDFIRASVEHLGSGDARVGLIGFSFAGGLALLAATEPETAAHLKYVASIGGYHDLSRTLRFLATHKVESPTGVESRRAHEYGLLVLLYGNLDRFDLGEDADRFRSALKSWLMEDRRKAREHAASLRTKSAQSLFQLVENGQVARVSGKLVEILRTQEKTLHDLSPSGKLLQVNTEALVLHGADDNVIPPEETEFSRLELGRVGHPNHHVLITPLLDHVRVDHPGEYRQKWALVSFVSRLL